MKQDAIQCLKRFAKTQEGVEELIRHIMQRGQQNVHTPFWLCEQILAKLLEYSDFSKQKIAVLFNVEFLHVLVNSFGVNPDNIVMFADDEVEALFCELQYGLKRNVNLFRIDIEQSVDTQRLYSNKGVVNMKFDVVVGNPPYQAKSKDSKTKTQPIWDKFVSLGFKICNDNGHVVLVHPSGWRTSNNKIFTNAQVLKEKQIRYLEIHNEHDGVKTFGATTRYDWYVASNRPLDDATEVVDQNKIKTIVDLREYSFIPNAMIERVFSFLAKGDQKKVEVLHSFSAYESRKPHISESKDGKFIFPIIYSTPVAGPTIWYSSTNKNGHFGVPKVIFNPSRPIGFVVDKEGEYGMSQFCVGITGDAKYLDMVAKVILNQKTNGFAEFMESVHFTDKIFNKEIISLFRKDFWKEFV